MRRVRIRWLFVIPAVCAVWTPLYARTSPTLDGIPFLIWFQFAAVAIGSLAVGIVYVVEGLGVDPATASDVDLVPGDVPPSAGEGHEPGAVPGTAGMGTAGTGTGVGSGAP